MFWLYVVLLTIPVAIRVQVAVSTHPTYLLGGRWSYLAAHTVTHAIAIKGILVWCGVGMCYHGYG